MACVLIVGVTAIGVMMPEKLERRDEFGHRAAEQPATDRTGVYLATAAATDRFQ